MTLITHSSLTDVDCSISGAASSLRICIITPDLLGPVRNGGIGTANTFLAYELAAAGHQVSILFTQCGTTATTSGPWLADYHQRGIDVSVAEEWAAGRGRINAQPNHAPLVMAHTVHDWLAEYIFDAVILMEWQGHGFYALQAKRGGLRFQKTAFITQIHSPSLWHAANNADLPTEPMHAITYFMERKSVELADAVISPSAYMLDWVRSHGYNPPALSFVQPNLLNVQVPTVNGLRPLTSVDEVVFFGRLEYRKGLVQFCDALDRLASDELSPHCVTFLGKFARVGQEHSGLYIARRAKNWNFPIKILARFGQAEALEYLSEPGRLAVMPSVADNSPYTVYECLAASIPFLARDVGGVAELIALEDRAACLFNDNPGVLAQMLGQILTKGSCRPRLAFTLASNSEAWRTGLPALVQQINQKSRSKKLSSAVKPWVSVCLTHYNRPKLLRQAVDSLLKQDYSNFEVILVDDGSPGQEANQMLLCLEPEFTQRGWKILRLVNGYLGKARNEAVRAAKGEYLLFMDDDNVARTNMVSCFVKAAVSSESDLVTAVFDVFSGDKKPTSKTLVAERFLPVGDIVSFSVVTNAIGDANSLIRRSLFEKLGGFSEDYGLGHEDFELYLRAVLIGAKVAVVPEPLFWYRRNGESMLTATHAAANRMRSFRPFLEHLPAPLAELAVLALGLATERIPKSSTDYMGLSELLPADRQRLISGDPDAPEAIVTVANVLKSMGHKTIADTIIEDLTRPMMSAQEGALNATVISAARQGNLKQLNKLLAELAKSSAKHVVTSVCYTTLAAIDGQISNADAIEILAQRLVREMPDSLEAHLTAAKYLLAAGCSSAGLKNISVALALADECYLRFRPDVRAAVDSKLFSCGLEHYYLYGRDEGTPWPDWHLFMILFPRLLKSINEEDAADLARDINIMLALEVFSS